MNIHNLVILSSIQGQARLSFWLLWWVLLWQSCMCLMCWSACMSVVYITRSWIVLSERMDMINLAAIASFPKWRFDLVTSYQQYMRVTVDPYFTITWESHLVDFNSSVFIIVSLMFFISVKLNMFACFVVILISPFVKY